MYDGLDFRLLDGLSDAVLALSSTGSIAYLNPAAERLLGWPAAELVGQPLTKVMPLRLHAPQELGFLKLLGVNKPRTLGKPLRVPAKHQDGHELEVELTLSNFQVDQHDLLIASIRDLKDRVELERQRATTQATEAQRAILQSIFMQMPSPVAIIRGPELVFELTNMAYLQLVGRKDLVGRKAREEFPAPESQPFLALMEQVFQTGEAYRGNEVPVMMNRGEGTPYEERFFNIVYQPLRQLDGKVDGVISVSLEVTEQVRARRETQDSERRAQFLAQASALLSTSLDFKVTLESVARLALPTFADFCIVDLLEPNHSINRVAFAHVDPAREKLLHELKARYAPQWDSPQPVARVLRSGKPEFLPDVSPQLLVKYTLDADHAALLTGIGVSSHISVPMVVRGQTIGVLSFGYSDASRHYTPDDVVVAQELAQRAAHAVDNTRLYNEAQEAVQVRDDFLSVASHELRTPLTPLQLNVQAMQRAALKNQDPPLLAPRQLEKLDTISRQVGRLEKLVGSLLDVTRISGKKLVLDFEDVDLVSLASEAVEQLSTQGLETNSVVKVAAEQPVTGTWDKLRLEQIVVNLVSNALKFGGGKPIEVTVNADSDTAVLAVRDSGIGIVKEDQERIFGRFERAASKRHYGGLGLGLWLTQQLVEAMHGTIQVESELGKGSTFTVKLPRKRVAEVEGSALTH